MPWGPPFTLGHENAGLGGDARRRRDRTCPSATRSRCTAHGDAAGASGACCGMENYCENGSRARRRRRRARVRRRHGAADARAAGAVAGAARRPRPGRGGAAQRRGADAVPRDQAVARRCSVPGTTAVVIGAGGLGQMAVQLLKCLSPASVIVVDQRHERARLGTRRLGADHTVVAGGTAAAAEVMELTSGRGAEAVFDVVGVDATLALAASGRPPDGSPHDRRASAAARCRSASSRSRTRSRSRPPTGGRCPSCTR